MKYYCMCQITGDVPTAAIDSGGFGPLDNQVYMAPNRFLPYDDRSDFRSVYLRRSMECEKNGITQIVGLGDVPNRWANTKEELDKDMNSLILMGYQKHYPNVDMYKCPVCGAIIIVE